METEKERDKRRGIIRAVWCVDNENVGMEYLIDLNSNDVLAIKKDGKFINPEG